MNKELENKVNDIISQLAKLSFNVDELPTYIVQSLYAACYHTMISIESSPWYKEEEEKELAKWRESEYNTLEERRFLTAF